MEKGEFITAALLILISYLYVDHLKYEERPIVQTENGKLRGIVSSASEYQGKYTAFMGIPYATAKRFEPPEPLTENWTDIRDSGYYRKQCIQLDILFSGLMFGDEKCLYLNVFVPTVNHNKSLPVMVFIHGGYWHVGSSQDHGEKRFMGESSVILVTVNYRLGALGFLSTGDGVVRGNMGLKDQNMALKWVQRNIKSFNGDPSRVTIFGESVGAASVNLHMISPASRRLFQRAISQSGTALSEFATNYNPKRQAQRFAKKFNCPTHDSKAMVKCLKELDASVLVYEHREAFKGFRSKDMMFAATIEVINDTKAFLVEDPKITIEKGNFQKVPWMLGVNAHEGQFTSAGVAANDSKINILQDWKTGIPTVIMSSRNDQLSEKIQNFYFKNDQSFVKEDFIANLTNFISDYEFNYPVSKSAKIHSKHAETYLYYLNYRGYFTLSNFWYDREDYFYFGHPVISMVLRHSWRIFQEFILRQPVVADVTCHGDELPLLFNFGWMPDFISMLPSRDVVMSRKIIRLWTNFAKSGNQLTIDKTTWEPINHKNETLKYLELSTNPSMIDEPFRERMKFWNSIFTKIEPQ